MSAVTQPAWMLPFTATASNVLRVTYDDAAVDNVALTAGTYYWRNTGASDDLRAHLQTRLNAAAVSKGHTWTVTMSALGRLTITASGGSSPVVSIRFLLSTLTSRDLGFTTAPGSPDTIAPTSGETFAAAYQVRWLWLPRVSYAEDRETPVQDTRVHVTPGGGVTHVTEGSYRRRRVRVEFVEGERLYAWAAERIPVTVTAGDPNAALDAFITDYNNLVGVDGEPPALVYSPDEDTRSNAASFRVAFLDERFLSNLEDVVDEAQQHPLQGAVVIEMVRA